MVKTRRNWSRGIRVLHWLTVAAVVVELVVSFGLLGQGMGIMVWLPLHISLGALILGIICVRLVWRVVERAPERNFPPVVRMSSAVVK